MAKLIEFTAYDSYIEAETEEVYPKPIKFYLSDWYKELKEGDFDTNRTIKACKPFFDTQITGYALPNPRDIHINHNYVNEEGYRDLNLVTNMIYWNDPGIEAINVLTHNNIKKNIHSQAQLGSKCPYHKSHSPNGSNYGYPKILLPWRIKTPPGYSCLIVPPLNKVKKNYEILSGIVDTDRYNQEINLPYRLHGEVDKAKEFTIKRGEIIAQVIPYKKESWQMKINKYPIQDFDKWMIKRFLFYKKYLGNYASFMWRKVHWK